MYQIINGKLKIIIKNTLKNFEIDAKNYKFVTIVYVAENPAEVITMYMEDDGQDIELPLPADMIERITYEVLRTDLVLSLQNTKLRLLVMQLMLLMILMVLNV